MNRKSLPWLVGLGGLLGLLLAGGKKKRSELPLPEPDEEPGEPEPQPSVQIPTGIPTSWQPTIPQPTMPQPTMPQPSVPQPTMPQPSVPQVTIPQPTIPQPTIPQPTIPEPAVPEPAAPEPTIPQPSVPQPTIETPSVVPADTAALARLMLQDESGPNWKKKYPSLMTWQGKRGLTTDGKFGPGSALRMAQEIGTLPIVRFWPKGSQREPAVQAFRELLIEEAQNAPEPRKSQLYAATEREQGQGFGRGQEAIATLIDLGVAA
jgi:hypothetical protein